MIKFFRKIRQNSLSEGKSGKYFKYAIGEIILVVIGILIALSINSWNENRINQQNEKLILMALHKEFISNKIQLDTVLFINRRSLQSVKYVRSKLPIDIQTTNLDSLAYHLFTLGYTYTFNPSKGVTNALINSSTFNLISNNELRQLLIGWDDVVTDYQEEEINALNNYVNQLKPFEKKHFYWDNSKNWLTDPRVNLSILESLEFDNYILDRYYDLTNILENNSGELKNMTKTIDKIIELSKPRQMND
ncbi:MAG TPA: DUF6090 family protein [Gillisia sp.]|nr:DUF6090 family protein [Gillisia sp.]